MIILLRNIVLFFSCCLMASCIVPESTHRESTFHLLSKSSLDINKSSKLTKELGFRNLAALQNSFYLKQIELPYYLQENRIINRPISGKIEFLENERWGEPLADGIGRVLGLNLSQMLNSPFYSVFPHRQKVGTRYEIGVNINRFERVAGSKVLLEGTWQLFANDFKKGSYPLMNGKESVLVEIHSSKNGSEIVKEVLALSKTLHILAEQISIAIVRQN
jgi:uncharacterized lipoprotein YmbA